MNGSPVMSYHSELFLTPSRKPTQHHCNADRKHAPFKALDEAALAPLCKNLFGERMDFQSNNPACNAKLFR